MSKIVTILSGGLDSSVLLLHLRSLGHEVKALSINYGQRHSIELAYAGMLCRALGVDWEIADLSAVRGLLAGSSQTSPDIPVPHGHYAAENMKQTVVPNRNMIMLSVAIGWAVSLKYDAVAYGAHAGDHAIYPDCRPEFAAAMDHAAQLCDWHRVQILRPFLLHTKAGIVGRGAELGLDFTQTYSCYEGKEKHCGLCGTCFERKEAFRIAGVADPTSYADGRL